MPIGRLNRKGRRMKDENDVDQAIREIRAQPALPGFAAESAGLGPLPAGPFMIGRVRGVNDEGARLVSTFVPTAYELEVLARHYLEAIQEINFYGRYAGMSASYGIRFGPFADRRLDTIAEALGEEAFDRAVASVRQDWEKRRTDIEERLAKPCMQCGHPREFGDLGRLVPEYQDDALCLRCYEKGGA